MHKSSTVYKSKTIQTNMPVDFDGGWTFSLEEELLWIMDSGLLFWPEATD